MQVRHLRGRSRPPRQPASSGRLVQRPRVRVCPVRRRPWCRHSPSRRCGSLQCPSSAASATTRGIDPACLAGMRIIGELRDAPALYELPDTTRVVLVHMERQFPRFDQPFESACVAIRTSHVFGTTNSAGCGSTRRNQWLDVRQPDGRAAGHGEPDSGDCAAGWVEGGGLRGEGWIAYCRLHIADCVPITLTAESIRNLQ